MTVSVIMCTYNGAKYIEEQLHTIYRQSRQPEEVLIRDDGSTDETVAIIERFIRQHGLQDTWHVQENAENLGWKRNFMQGITETKEDLIFFADQDDIWHPRKIEIMSGMCEKHPGINLLVCDCYPFDDVTGERKKWFLPSLGERKLNRVTIGRSFADCLRPGCTYALRGCMKEYIADLWQEEWPHDLFFWCVALAQGSLYHCRKVLVKWRRAEGNNTPRNEKNRECRLEVLGRQQAIAGMLTEKAGAIGIPEENLEQIEQAKQVYEKRRQAMGNRDLAGILRLLPYLRFYPKNSTWAGDLLAVMR